MPRLFLAISHKILESQEKFVELLSKLEYHDWEWRRHCWRLDLESGDFYVHFGNALCTSIKSAVIKEQALMFDWEGRRLCWQLDFEFWNLCMLLLLKNRHYFLTDLCIKCLLSY